MEIFGAIGNEGLFPQPEQGSLLSPIFRPALSSPLRPFHCSRPCRQQRQKKALRLPNPNDGRFWSPMAKTNVLNPTKGRSWCARTVPKKNDTGYPRPSGTRKRKRRRIMPRPGQRSSRITRMRRGWGARTAVRRLAATALRVVRLTCCATGSPSAISTGRKNKPCARPE